MPQDIGTIVPSRLPSFLLLLCRRPPTPANNSTTEDPNHIINNLCAMDIPQTKSRLEVWNLVQKSLDTRDIVVPSHLRLREPMQRLIGPTTLDDSPHKIIQPIDGKSRHLIHHITQRPIHCNQGQALPTMRIPQTIPVPTIHLSPTLPTRLSSRNLSHNLILRP